MRVGVIGCIIWIASIFLVNCADIGTLSQPAKSCNDVLRNVQGYSNGIYYVQADAVSIVPVYCNFDVFPGRGAALLYKLSAGTPADTYSLWTNFEPLNDYDTSLLTINKSTSHYVSRLLSYWGNIQQVSIAVYRGGIQRKFINFNTTTTSPTTFFQPSQVVNSSWSDLQDLPSDWGQSEADKDFGRAFSINSFANGRNWYISEEWITCGQDIQWLIVSNGDDVCDSVNFNGTHSNKLQITYSDSLNASANYAFAGVFTIWGDLDDIDASRGFSVDTPLTSCNDLIGKGNVGRGVFYMQFNASDVIPVYCDFRIFSDSAAHMIFKINANQTSRLPDLYLNATTVNDTLENVGTFTTGLSQSHYVSRIQAQISQMTRVSTRLYIDSVQQAFINFNVPQGSNISDWFSPDTQYESSWIDLPNNTSWLTMNDTGYDPHHIFAIHPPPGTLNNAYNRTFYINRLWGGCGNDTAWLQINPSIPEFCEKKYWPNGRPHNESTTIFFSTLNTQAKPSVSSQFALAQTFVVWAELLPVPCACNSTLGGNCAFMGQCICNPNFVGLDCGQCTPDHYGPSCLFCNNSLCGHGSCGEDAMCTCDLGYAGENCSTCATNYFGPNCDCESSSTCGHGACNSAGECVCDEYFAGPNCSMCFNQSATYPHCKVRQQCGDGICNASIGENCANCIWDCTAPCGICGDGYCSAKENCSNCYLDCGPCKIDTLCPNCSNNGVCKDGVCFCVNSFSGPNCDTKTAPPLLNTTTGSSVNITHAQTNYTVSVVSISELASNGTTVRSFFVANNSYPFTKNETTTYTLWHSSITIEDQAYLALSPLDAASPTSLSYGLLDISIYFYPNLTNITFANQTITIQPNTLKINTGIQWNFLSATNSLAVTLRTTSSQLCDPITGYQQGDALQWVRMGNSSSSLYAQFLQYAEIDGVYKKITFSWLGNGLVRINIPHFWESALVDPSYNVLLESNSPPKEKQNIQEQSNCERTNNPKSHGWNGGITAAICACVIVFLAIVGIVIEEIWRRRRNKRISAHFK